MLFPQLGNAPSRNINCKASKWLYNILTVAARRKKNQYSKVVMSYFLLKVGLKFYLSFLFPLEYLSGILYTKADL